MGVDYVSHVFIGRKCTAEEVSTCLEAVKNVNGDFSVFDPEEPLKSLQSQDGHPVFAYLRGACYLENAMDEIEDAEWFVVVHYLKRGNTIMLSASDVSQMDDQFQLIVLSDVC